MSAKWEKKMMYLLFIFWLIRLPFENLKEKIESHRRKKRFDACDKHTYKTVWYGAYCSKCGKLK